MRYVEILVSEDQERAVLETLREGDIDFVRTAVADDETASLIRFPLPTEAVESVLNDLHECGLPEDRYMVVTGAEAVTTPHFSELKDRYANENGNHDTIAYEEIRAQALDAMPNRTAYVAMALLSTVIATIGLLQNSALAVAGAMVVSPFVGAVLSTNIGLLTGERRVVVDAFVAQLLGMVLAIVGAGALTWLFTANYIVSPDVRVAQIDQISALISPSLTGLVLALASGAAGALALATAFPIGLAGVAVAIALIPAAAAVGVGIATGNPTVAVGALTLLVMNVVAINVAVVGTLYALGYRPKGSLWPSRPSALGTLTALFVLLVAVAFVVGAAIPTYEQVKLERSVNHAVSDTLSRPQYRHASLVSIQLGYTGGPFVSQPTSVTVVISRPSGTAYPNLISTLERQISVRSNQHVRVQIQYVDHASRSSSSTSTRRTTTARRTSG